MDTELLRFRIDPEIRDKAVKVCANLGLELSDVLRAVVTRIARDGRLPAEIGTTAREPSPAPVPFGEYNEHLWASLKPRIDAEIAIALLSRFIAECSTRIDEGSGAKSADAEVTERLTRERDEALALRRTLDVADAEAVRQVIDKYGPRLRDLMA